MTDALPPGWAWATIGEVADVRLGRQRSPQYHSGRQMRPYLRAANVTWKGIRLEDVKEMNFADNDFETYRLEPGDILLNEASGSPNEVGKPAIWRGEIEGACFQNTLLRLRASAVDVGYLYWYCFFAALTGRFGEAGRGVNIRHLGKQGLMRFPIAVAPRLQQQRIVAAIEEHFSRLDAAAGAACAAGLKAAASRRSILVEALSGRLSAQNQGDEPASMLLDRIAAAGLRSKSLPSADEPQTQGREPVSLWELPRGWAWAQLQDLTASERRSITDGPFGSNLKTAHYTTTGPRVIRLQNIGDGEFKREDAHISPEHFESLRAHSVQSGDLIVASLGESLPRACLVPHWVPPAIVKADCIRVRLHSDVNRSYVNMALQDPRLRRATAADIKGVGRPRLGLRGIRQLTVPVPPRAEQDRIVEVIEAQFARLGAISGAVSAVMSKIEAMRRTVLAQAFAGRLVSQSPSDEAASVMLERIGAGA